ncbi:neurofibromin-like [Cavia porcellus]|uniref:neurofibromin-like n=1 Tax=Cavia porcellus TaxID=10141 RepID=UPI002FE420D3
MPAKARTKTGAPPLKLAASFPSHLSLEQVVRGLWVFHVQSLPELVLGHYLLKLTQSVNHHSWCPLERQPWVASRVLMEAGGLPTTKGSQGWGTGGPCGGCRHRDLDLGAVRSVLLVKLPIPVSESSLLPVGSDEQCEVLGSAGHTLPRTVCWTLKINTLLSLCQDPNLLNPIREIVQSVVYHEESPLQYQTSYLQSFGFNGLWRFAGPFSKQTQIQDYAELIVKFLDALIDTYLPGIDEETTEESLLTPTSPHPPALQSQLSITANLNVSNSMTSLATSQHSPGIDKENVELSPTTGHCNSGRTRHGSASQVQKQSAGSFKCNSINKIM